MILDALRTALGPGVPILGGGAAPHDPSKEADGGSSLEFAGDVLTGDALAILLFAGPLAFSFGVETGWRGVGPRATITRTLRRRRARDRRATSAGVLRALRRHGPPPVANPLAVFEEPGSDRFYLRTPVAYDRERGSMTFFGAVPEGATVQLTMAGTDEIFDGTRASIADALARFPRASSPTAPSSSPARRASSCWGRAPVARSRSHAKPWGRRCRSAGSTAWGRSRRWRRATGRSSTTPRWSRSCSGPHRRTRSSRLDDRASRLGLVGRAGEGEPAAHPSPSAPRGQRPAARGVPGFEHDARVSSARRARGGARADRSGCCSTCCRSGSSTAWRPGRR